MVFLDAHRLDKCAVWVVQHFCQFSDEEVLELSESVTDFWIMLDNSFVRSAMSMQSLPSN